jgi:sterol desaturase/sphingolipid hydroxylase (fatty acid hydroxylase superfamily)
MFSSTKHEGLVMPTPIDILLDPISVVLLGIYALFIAWEAIAPGRDLPKVPGWRLRGFASFVIYFYLSSYLPLLTDTHLARYQLLDLGWLGWSGGLVARVVYDGLMYGWHRALHGSSLLWRVFHQFHHSAERLDTAGAFYFHPTDMAGWTLVGSIAGVLLCGLTPAATTVFLVGGMLMGVFQHCNVRTPRWLGYLVQRPESHTVHHGMGLHYCNFSDLPVFDMLFGTFRNPAEYEMATGFYPGASGRILDMLRFKDVSEPPQPSAGDDIRLQTAA